MRLRLGRLGSFGVCCIGAFCFAAAAQELADIVRYPQPIPITYDQFVHNPPTSGLYDIKGALFVIPHGEVVSLTGVVGNLYVPLQKTTDNASSPIKILVNPSDPKVGTTFQELMSLNNAPPEQRQSYYNSHMSVLVYPHDVIGTVDHGLDYATIERLDLLHEDSQMDPNVVFVDESRRPSWTRFGIDLFASVVLIGLVLREVLGRPQSSAA
jgi:hypothetical protein